MLVPVSGMVIMASVKLSGELMQEIHQISLLFTNTLYQFAKVGTELELVTLRCFGLR